MRSRLWPSPQCRWSTMIHMPVSIHICVKQLKWAMLADLSVQESPVLTDNKTGKLDLHGCQTEAALFQMPDIHQIVLGSWPDNAFKECRHPHAVASRDNFSISALSPPQLLSQMHTNSRCRPLLQTCYRGDEDGPPVLTHRQAQHSTAGQRQRVLSADSTAWADALWRERMKKLVQAAQPAACKCPG